MRTATGQIELQVKTDRSKPVEVKVELSDKPDGLVDVAMDDGEALDSISVVVKAVKPEGVDPMQVEPEVDPMQVEPEGVDQPGPDADEVDLQLQVVEPDPTQAEPKGVDQQADIASESGATSDATSHSKAYACWPRSKATRI